MAAAFFFLLKNAAVFYLVIGLDNPRFLYS